MVPLACRSGPGKSTQGSLRSQPSMSVSYTRTADNSPWTNEINQSVITLLFWVSGLVSKLALMVTSWYLYDGTATILFYNTLAYSPLGGNTPGPPNVQLDWIY